MPANDAPVVRYTNYHHPLCSLSARKWGLGEDEKQETTKTKADEMRASTKKRCVSSHAATLLTQEQKNPGRGGRPELPCRADRSGVRRIKPSTPCAPSSTENRLSSCPPVNFHAGFWLARWYGRLLFWLGLVGQTGNTPLPLAPLPPLQESKEWRTLAWFGCSMLVL